MQKLFSWLKLSYLRSQQEKIIFKPYPKNVDEMLLPTAYGLQDVADVFLTTEDGHELHVWLYRSEGLRVHAEMEAEAAKVMGQEEDILSDDHEEEVVDPPFVVLFHGNTGHWGDVGKPEKHEEYNRHYRIELLKTLQERGVSFCAVSLRGYGKSAQISPSEIGFGKDIITVVDYVLEEQQIPQGHVIIMGESLGASVAMQCAVTFTQRGVAPAKLVTIAAFSSMQAKVLDLHPDLQTLPLKKAIRHPFDGAKALSKLTTSTRFYAFYPEFDESTDVYHSEILYNASEKQGLESQLIKLPDATHIVWDVKQIVDEMLS